MSLTASNRMLLTPSAKSIMHRCKVIAIQSEADKSDVIYRLFLFAANPNENKKEEWGVKIGNGDYDFGVRPTYIRRGFWAAKSISRCLKHTSPNPDGFRCTLSNYIRLWNTWTRILCRIHVWNHGKWHFSLLESQRDINIRDGNEGRIRFCKG